MKKGSLILIILALGGLGGCLQTQNSSSQDLQLYGDLPVGSPDYLEVQAILSRSCVPCHSFQGLTSDQMIATGLVVAAQPENSKLYYRLAGSSGSNGPKDMPTSGALTAADVDKFKVFIEGL